MPLLRALAESTKASLIALPETGMGFQIVSAQLTEGRRANWLILNTDIAVELSDEEDIARWLAFRRVERGPRGHNLADWLAGVPDDLMALHDLRLLAERIPAVPIGLYPRLSTGATPARSALVKSETTATIVRLHRFSASAADRRVNSKTGTFAPGTYATTETDRPMAPSGFAAVGRYALPNIQPASYVYSIDAAKGTHLEIGTVGPAYNQAGGGVEVHCPQGATHTGLAFTGPRQISDE